ncbi:MAG: [FeFe] hydrogenase, group A [Holophagae bacterium]|nr:[FeFe] hydrogenase, group A [Holophagae bacterium]
MTEMITVHIDDITCEVEKGTTILSACQRVGLRIPTLCHHPDLEVAGICRICVVEVEGMNCLQAACAYPIHYPIKVRTNSSRVRRARRVNLDLILSEHYGDCYTCVRNGSCELQTLAEEYGIDRYRFPSTTEPKFKMDRSTAIVRDQNKCILCNRCIRTCIDLQQVSALETANRGYNVSIQTAFDKPISEVVCINCGQCINRCPTGALRSNMPNELIWEVIDDPEKHVIIQTAPSPRAAIGEEFDYEPGTSVTKKLNAALRRMGFDNVFDTNFAADLTIMEEGSELLARLKKVLVDGDSSVKIPMFTSCSPGWVKYAEHYYPEYLDHLSTCKSPQQMFGAILKTYYARKMGIDPKKMVVVALMPCVAKKFECNRPEMVDSGWKDVDFGLTTREMAVMIKEASIHLKDMPDEDFDHPMGLGSGAGMIFGATGGVMEAAIRTVYEIVTGRPVPFKSLDITPLRGMDGIRDAALTIENPLPEYQWLDGVTLKVAVAHGTANARLLMEKLKKGTLDYHFIEIMACPGGCLGGGGQPIPTTPEIRAARARAIYAEDHELAVRKSHENSEIQQLYAEFLGKPLGHVSHKLLHTYYTPRGRFFQEEI